MARATSEASSLFRGNNVMNLVASSEVWPITSNLFSVAGKTVLIYGWIARDRFMMARAFVENGGRVFIRPAKDPRTSDEEHAG